MRRATALRPDEDDIGVTSYDLLLLALPVPLVLGAVSSALLGVSTAVGVGIGGLPSVLLLAYGLFAVPPTTANRSARGRGRRRGRRGAGGA